MSRRAWLLVLAADALVLAVVLLLALGFIRVHGWADWSVGTDTAYCGVYWPHLDFYCQSGH